MIHSLRHRLLGWLPAVIWAAFIFSLSSLPGKSFPDLNLLGDIPSIIAHIGLYAVFMFLLSRALQRQSWLSPSGLFRVAFVIVALYAISDEYHQSFVPGRYADFLDWLADMVGATLAWVWLVRLKR